MESVSCSLGSKKEDSSIVDKEKKNFSLSTSHKIRRIRRRTTEDDIGGHVQEAYFKVMTHSKSNTNINQYIISTQEKQRTNKILERSAELEDYLSRRRRSNTSPDMDHLQLPSQATSNPVPMDIVKTDLVATEKFKKLNFNHERKSKSLKKLRELVENVLRNNLQHCTYNAELSRKRCTHLSQILETTLKSSLNTGGVEYKVVAIVYIGEVRENGMKQSCQYNWNPDTDFFVMETYRRDDLFATGIVFATMVDNHDVIVDTNNNSLEHSPDDKSKDRCVRRTVSAY